MVKAKSQLDTKTSSTRENSRHKVTHYTTLDFIPFSLKLFYVASHMKELLWTKSHFMFIALFWNTSFCNLLFHLSESYAFEVSYSYFMSGNHYIYICYINMNDLVCEVRPRLGTLRFRSETLFRECRTYSNGLILHSEKYHPQQTNLMHRVNVFFFLYLA